MLLIRVHWLKLYVLVVRGEPREGPRFESRRAEIFFAILNGDFQPTFHRRRTLEHSQDLSTAVDNHAELFSIKFSPGRTRRIIRLRFVCSPVSRCEQQLMVIPGVPPPMPCMCCKTNNFFIALIPDRPRIGGFRGGERIPPPPFPAEGDGPGADVSPPCGLRLTDFASCAGVKSWRFGWSFLGVRFLS